MSRVCRVFLAVCLALAFAAGVSPAADVYEWRDREGNSHFTDDLSQVPPYYRDKAKILSLPDHSPAGPAPEAEAALAGEEPQEEEGGELALPPPVDAAAECEAALQRDRDRLRKQLTDDQARLEEVIRRLHLTAMTRHRRDLERERAVLRESIAEAQRTQTEVFPQREWECRRKRAELPGVYPP